MLKSRACRTAIMFNDILNAEQCRQLVSKLSKCSFPFQCAHGRPTLAVLATPSDTNDCVPIMPLRTGVGHVSVGYGDAWRGWTDLE